LLIKTKSSKLNIARFNSVIAVIIVGIEIW